MKKSIRVLLAGMAIELLILLGGAFMIFQLERGALTPAGSMEETVSTITTTLGGAMGVIGGLVLVLFIVARRAESGQT
jgi:hypothetical protein